MSLRPHMSALQERRTDPDTRGTPYEFVHDLLVDRSLDQDARTERAALTAQRPGRTGCCIQRLLEIGVGENDVRRLATELECVALQRVGAGAQDGLRRGALAREGDLAHV